MLCYNYSILIRYLEEPFKTLCWVHFVLARNYSNLHLGAAHLQAEGKSTECFIILKMTATYSVFARANDKS